VSDPSNLTIIALKVEIWIAARLLPFTIGSTDFSQMLQNVDAPVSERYKFIAPEIIALVTKAATRHPWLMRNRRCLREGLIGYRFMRKAGYQPELHFGIEDKSLKHDRINAHCWVVLNGKPIVNDTLPDMTTIHIHSAHQNQRTS
jgi:hypothetical protein